MDPSHPHDLDDAVLDAARRGDGRAVRRVHDSLAPALLGYARGQRVDDPDAVANETLYRTLRDLASFDGDARRFRSWVFTVAHNLIVDEHRRRARRPATVSLDATVRARRAEGPPVADQVAARLEAEQLVALMDELTHDQRAVLLLRLVADLSVAQVAAVLGKRQGAVKTLHHRALAALRERLVDDDVTNRVHPTFTR